MQIHTEPTTIASRGLGAPTDFKINTSATAFKILSSSLYSDKVLAVVRELACNATDAHTAAGCPDRPIEVKLPNNLDNNFFVKDYGPGLTHDQIVEFYTTYFGSSKNDSNDQIGGFGLGCKAPFAYTDRFTVATTRDGETRTYAMFISDSGTPTFSLVNARPNTTEWLSGTLVQIPVMHSDFGRFQAAAQTLFPWFTIPPVSPEGTRLFLPQAFSIEAGPYKILHATPSGLSGKTKFAVMGGVPYPIDPTKILDFPNTNLPFAIFLPIGALDITVSRESLEYTARTIATLKHAATSFRNAIAEKIQLSVITAAPKTFEDWATLRRSLIAPHTPTNFSVFNGRLPPHPTDALINKFLFSYFLTTDLSAFAKNLNITKYTRTYYGKTKKQSHSLRDPLTIPFDGTITIVYDDKPIALEARIRHSLTHPKQTLLLISPSPTFSGSIEQEAAKLVSPNFPATILPASSLPRPPATPRTAKTTTSTTQLSNRPIYTLTGFLPPQWGRDGNTTLGAYNDTPAYFLPFSDLLIPNQKDTYATQIHNLICNSQSLHKAANLTMRPVFAIALNQTSSHQLEKLRHRPFKEALLEQLTTLSFSQALLPGPTLLWDQIYFGAGCFHQPDLARWILTHIAHNTDFAKNLRSLVPHINHAVAPLDKYLPATPITQLYRNTLTTLGHKSLPTAFHVVSDNYVTTLRSKLNIPTSLSFSSADLIFRLATSQPKTAAQMIAPYLS